MKSHRFLTLVVAACLAATVRAYGPDGHALVGAVADQLLQSDPTVSGKISTWLEGITLEEAANYPDKIKSWDKPEDQHNKWFHLPDHPAIEQQLRDFWRANPHLPQDPPDHDTVPHPDHHWFHFVDVPAFHDEKYAEAFAGTSKWDVVQMITYCAKVLHSDISAQNDRKITKPVAVILVAHFVGDIHQPLHVGAEYFDAQKKAVEPAAGVKFYDDQGGNKLILNLLDRNSDGNDDADENDDDEVNGSGAGSRFALKLHGFWDSNAVADARRLIKAHILEEHPGHSKVVHKLEYINYLATHTPAGTKMPGNLSFTKWSEAWANEIQPVAREAHERLEFTNIKLPKKGGTISSGIAKEKNLPEGYEDWAAEVVAGELAKAGARLAAILFASVSH